MGIDKRILKPESIHKYLPKMLMPSFVMMGNVLRKFELTVVYVTGGEFEYVDNTLVQLDDVNRYYVSYTLIHFLRYVVRRLYHLEKKWRRKLPRSFIGYCSLL